MGSLAHTPPTFHYESARTIWNQIHQQTVSETHNEVTVCSLRTQIFDACQGMIEHSCISRDRQQALYSHTTDTHIMTMNTNGDGLNLFL